MAGNFFILGIEAGATKTTAILVECQSGTGFQPVHNKNPELDRLKTCSTLSRAEAGPCNLKLLGDTAMLRLIRHLKRQLPVAPDRIAWCGAGVRTARDRQRVGELLRRVWPRVECAATNDVESGLRAGCGGAVGILVIAGTGSIVFGRNEHGETVRAGGYGHLLGDAASGYDISHHALRAVLHEWDRTGRWPALGAKLLRALALNDIEQLIDWAGDARKNDVAALAPAVFAAWTERDAIAAPIIITAAERLARDALLVARRLGYARRDAFTVCLKGSLFERQPKFFSAVALQIRKQFPRAKVALPEREGAWGAVMLAASRIGFPACPAKNISGQAGKPILRSEHRASELAVALTEQRNPRTMDLDRRSIPQLVETMLDEDARVVPAIRKQCRQIERAINLIVRAFRRGGRLFYVGAGTSGRLGVLDASECPPTFSVSPEMVQGIIAGGARALHSSVEAAEDDPSAGAEALQLRGVRRGDVVVGIAASGRTPFVLGALEWAKRHGVVTVFLNFNPAFAWTGKPTVTISVATGPEVVTGSTRLKAGTATKLILNMFTTIAMVRLGKVVSNLMVDVDPTCQKLRDRATRIVCALEGMDYETARQRLERAGWVVKKALSSGSKRR